MASISAFFPAYNDAESIGDLLLRTDRVLRELCSDHELIVVNDGSSDGTAAALRALQGRLPALRIITHEHNRGYGGALRSGFAAASKELVFYTDGDGQYDPSELRNLFAALSDETDVVQGFKRKRHDPLHRILIGRAYHAVVKFAFGLSIRDVDCDFRLIRRRVFTDMNLQFSSGVICVELMRRIEGGGFVIAEVPVNHYPRRHGRSQFFTFTRIFQTGRDLVQLWLMLGRSSRKAKHVAA